MARYATIPTFRTDRQGTVTITSDGTHLWIRTAD
jgi:beta-lactamase superfamily II metal-dependent hydrolase